MEELEKAGIPCGPVNTIDQAARDPQIAARNMFVDVKHPTAGDFKVVNSPFKFSRTHYKVERAAPELGEHTGEILSQLPGMTAEKISRLRDSGVI
jgi:crotonobetainyl-CoA:carnitine CoA-transferase CaiB-like acyl-CoA transferase